MTLQFISPQAHQAVVDECARLREEVARLQTALAIYADEDNWSDNRDDPRCYDDEVHWCGDAYYPWTVAQSALEPPQDTTTTAAGAAGAEVASGGGEAP